MTIAETVNYLMGVRSFELTIWRLSLQRDELQSCLLPAGIRYDKDVVQTSPEDKLSAIAGAVIELDQRIQELRQQKARLIMRITASIDRLPDSRERTILVAFYIGRKSIKEIAEIVTYSESHTYQLRRQGIRHLAEILTEDNNNHNPRYDNMVSGKMTQGD